MKSHLGIVQLADFEEFSTFALRSGSRGSGAARKADLLSRPGVADFDHRDVHQAAVEVFGVN